VADTNTKLLWSIEWCHWRP